MSAIFALAAGLALVAGDPVTEVRIAPDAERTQVLIAVDGDVEYRDFTMEGPSRLVVDVFGAVHALPRDNFLDVGRGGIRSVRSSQFAPDVVRIVLELDRTVTYEVSSEAGRIRISLAAGAGPFEPWSTGAGAPAPRTDPPGGASASPADSRATPPAAARQQQQAQARRISITFRATPIAEVIETFAEFAGRSIVAGSDVTGTVTATIENQPWDEALRTILEVNGFQARELTSGIIRVVSIEDLSQLETLEPIQTRPYRINYATAQELAGALEGILTERGAVSVGQGTNTVIVSDVPRVQEEVARLIESIDIRTPQVTIKAKIIFVNRTDLNEFGVTYDLKDSAGNQLNVITPGAADQDGDGVIELPDERVEIGTNVISLGGNSVAALGNANNRVVGPTLTLLNSLVLGRHTLLAFVEALQSQNLSDIQAEPVVRVSDNQTARIQVGEETPLRVLDAQAAGGAGGAAGGGAQGGLATLPQATVQIQETGIILEATPSITSTNDILLTLHAERSAPQLAESDAGFIFTTQEATTRVLVDDGETVVIGGLTVTEKNEVQAGIPLLMDLPVIGRFFRVTRQSEVQRDLLILVTPHIVRQNEL